MRQMFLKMIRSGVLETGILFQNAQELEESVLLFIRNCRGVH